MREHSVSAPYNAESEYTGALALVIGERFAPLMTELALDAITVATRVSMPPSRHAMPPSK